MRSLHGWQAEKNRQLSVADVEEIRCSKPQRIPTTTRFLIREQLAEGSSSFENLHRLKCEPNRIGSGG